MTEKLFYYKLNEKLLISKTPYNLKEIFEEEAKDYIGNVFSLNNLNPIFSRSSYSVTSPENIFIDKENLNLLLKRNKDILLPIWLDKHISERKIMAVNTAYPDWENALNNTFHILNKETSPNKKWRVTVVGLGDVGSTIITGLRLLGGEVISRINIYDKDENKMKRWEYECNQILPPSDKIEYPKIEIAKEDNLFDCDMFIFAVSIGVPTVGKETTDVRLIQFEGNSKIISHYSKLARTEKFKGIFAVISDPVDLLCKTVFQESNKNEDNLWDFKGLLPEQIRGYGLGVMHARACYYAEKNNKYNYYLKEGRAFGPHGEGLIIADSINNYNETISNYLTEKTKTSNMTLRSIGFKPYVAPALSSGTLSLIATIKGEWHYSATFLGGTFMGCRNRLNPLGIELETYLNMNPNLFKKLEGTYKNLL